MEAWKLHGFIHSGSGVETGGEEEQWERKERGKHETQTGRKENLLTKTPSCTPIQLLLTSSHEVSVLWPGAYRAKYLLLWLVLGTVGSPSWCQSQLQQQPVSMWLKQDTEGYARLSSCRWAQGYLPHVDKWVQVSPTYKPHRLESKLPIIPPRCPHPAASPSRHLVRNPAKTNRWFTWQGQL